MNDFQDLRLSTLFVSPSSLPYYQRNSYIHMFFQTLCTHIFNTLIFTYVCHYYAANLV